MSNDTSQVNMNVILSLKKVVENYRKRQEKETSNFKKLYLSSILGYADRHEELIEGIQKEDLPHFEEPLNILLSELFPAALTENEIKAATIPFSNVLFNKTQRFKNILKNAGDDFEMTLMSGEDFNYYRMACGVILNRLYDRSIDFSSPIFVDIPDQNKNLRTYRITYNADFVEVLSNEGHKRLSENDVKELLRNPDDEQLWKSSFSDGAYTFKGFGIISLTDVTIDRAISDLKTILLSSADGDSRTDDIQSIFRNIFNLDYLRIGFTGYYDYDGSFETMFYDKANSFLLGDYMEKSCEDVLCHHSFKTLIESKEPLVITDVNHYASQIKNTFLTDRLQEQDIASAILYPIVNGERLIGVLEVVSKVVFALNSFNVGKIDSVADYIMTALIRTEQEYENKVKALIQTECTSIHSSVQWKFAHEARRIIKSRSNSSHYSTFKDLVFPDVYPLYGQIDIVGSSDARNDSIKNDLINQLDMVGDIFASAKAIEPMPIYDQIYYRIFEYRKGLLEENINADSERDIIKLLNEEINPIVKHLEVLSTDLNLKVKNYKDHVDPSSGVIYELRNLYDNTVQEINETLSAYLDTKQQDAQAIFPHYFERFKTDGVEHNIYVGASISPSQEFNIVYINNLRLWQLKTMIEMENKFYSLQRENEQLIHAASMILVFDNTLSIRYRIDEKRFDVDGTYNARYEVIKKRIDKAHIKNTNERVTQKGKIAIIYTNKETEREYMRYINFLQHNKMIDHTVETLELEDVQGVIGLKALRVQVLYDTTAEENNSQKAISFETMIERRHSENLNNQE